MSSLPRHDGAVRGDGARMEKEKGEEKLQLRIMGDDGNVLTRKVKICRDTVSFQHFKTYFHQFQKHTHTSFEKAHPMKQPFIQIKYGIEHSQNAQMAEILHNLQAEQRFSTHV